MRYYRAVSENFLAPGPLCHGFGHRPLWLPFVENQAARPHARLIPSGGEPFGQGFSMRVPIGNRAAQEIQGLP
jgi:hypothetical protein